MLNLSKSKHRTLYLTYLRLPSSNRTSTPSSGMEYNKLYTTPRLDWQHPGMHVEHMCPASTLPPLGFWIPQLHWVIETLLERNHMMTLPNLPTTFITLRTDSCFTQIMKASNAKCSHKPCLLTPLRYGGIPLLQGPFKVGSNSLLNFKRGMSLLDRSPLPW